MLCIRSDAADDLETRKIYQIVPDVAAAREGFARVIDESGEDYLYPTDYFLPLRLPAAVSRRLVSPPHFARPSGRRAAAR